MVTSQSPTIASAKPPPVWKADLVLAIIALVWGTTFVLIKNALADISTTYFLALRFSLASLCMLPILFRVEDQSRSAVWRGLRGGAIAGIFLWLGYLLQTFGLKYTTASNSGFLTGLYIVAVPIVSAAAYRKWPHVREIAGITAAGGGIVLLTLPSASGPFRVNHGDLLTIGCAMAFAVHMVVLGYFAGRERVEAVALGQIACAALLSIVSLVFEPPAAIWSGRVVASILVTGIFATGRGLLPSKPGHRNTPPQPEPR